MVAAGGAYVLFVKQNQSTLYQDLALFFEDPPLDCQDWRSVSSTNKGHGRLEQRVVVSRFSTITVARNVYSVPSRLIGATILVRVHAEALEGYVGTSRVFEIPRQIGTHQHRIDYHHIVHSLVRKPGAFAAYRYRDDLFPTTIFRMAYDRLVASGIQRADRDYVRILHLAATTSEAEVETALQIVLEANKVPTFLSVRDLIQIPSMQQFPTFSAPELNLSMYDQLIPSTRRTEIPYVSPISQR